MFVVSVGVIELYPTFTVMENVACCPTFKVSITHFALPANAVFTSAAVPGVTSDVIPVGHVAIVAASGPALTKYVFAGALSLTFTIVAGPVVPIPASRFVTTIL